MADKLTYDNDQIQDILDDAMVAPDYVDGNEYKKGATIRIGDWTQTAKQITSQYPSPQYSGDTILVIPDFTENSYVDDIVTSGTKLVANKAGIVNQITLMPGDSNVNSQFTVRLAVYNSEPEDGKIVTFTGIPLTEGLVSTFDISPLIVAAGQTVEIALIANNSATNIDIDFDYNWVGAVSTIVSAGESNCNPSGLLLRLSYTDDHGTWREADIKSITVGSIVTVSSVATPSNYAKWQITDLRDYNSLDTSFVVVLIEGNISSLELEPVLLHVEIPVAAGNDYVSETGYWGVGANLPSWASSVEGTLAYGAVVANRPDDAFGAIPSFRAVNFPTEWKTLCYSGVYATNNLSASLQSQALLNNLMRLLTATGTEFDVGKHKDGNYVIFAADGTITLFGTASVWKSMITGLMGKGLSSNVGKADYNYENNAVDFARNGDINNIKDVISGNYRIGSEYKVGANIIFYPRIHWFQESHDNYIWAIKWRIQSHGSQKTTAWNLIQAITGTANNVYPYLHGVLNQITVLPTISVDCKAEDIVQFHLARIDSNSGEVTAYGFDLHGEVDKLGTSNKLTN